MPVPRYREEFLLGAGGMAEVWKAKGPRGAVAIKRLLPHAARNPSIAAAFEREGRLLSRISHPNVVGIHEVTRDERGTCLVLEYVEGADLTGIAGRLSESIALRIIRDVLRALVSVHALCDEQGRPLGLIHRDLSLANLLVDLDGRVKLTDFGLARAVSGSQAATTGQSIKGTLAYLAPEQARGAPVDARTDLFAAGALLYEMLAGKPIYDDDDPRIALARARAGDVASLSSKCPTAPLPLVEFVDRALAAEAADRFPNAEMMLGELERVAAMASGFADDAEMAGWARSYMLVMPRPRRPAARTVVLVRRSRVAFAAALSAAALALFLGLYLGLRSEPRPSPALLATSAEPMTVVIPAQAAPEPIAENAAPTSSNTGIPAGEDRPARKARPAPVAPSGGLAHSRPTDDHSSADVPKEACILDIGSEPAFAYVSIDGVKVGSTPIFGREVKPGAHRIQVWRDGLGSKTFTLEIRPGDRITRVVKLP